MVSAKDAENSLLCSTSVFACCKETHMIWIRSQEYNAFEVILCNPTIKISTSIHFVYAWRRGMYVECGISTVTHPIWRQFVVRRPVRDWGFKARSPSSQPHSSPEFINLFALASLRLNCNESHALKEREGILAKMCSTFFSIQ